MFKGYKTIDEEILFLINVKGFFNANTLDDPSALLIATDLCQTCADSNSFCTINCVETIASPKNANQSKRYT